MPKRPTDDDAAEPTVRARPGSMSGEDRDLDALRRRRERAATPPLGVPVDPDVLSLLGELGQIEHDLETEADEFDEQHTPIREILQLAGTSKEQAIVIALWRHTANQELRFRRARNRSSEGQMRRELDELKNRVTDISGKDGTNGKLGETKRRVDNIGKLGWLVLGGIGAAAIKVVLMVRAFDAVEAQSLHNAQQILELSGRVLRLETEALRRHRFPPAEAPDRKDTP